MKRVFLVLILLFCSVGMDSRRAEAGYWKSPYSCNTGQKFRSAKLAMRAAKACFGYSICKYYYSRTGGIFHGRRCSTLVRASLGVSLVCYSNEERVNSTKGGPARCAPKVKKNTKSGNCSPKSGNPVSLNIGNKEQSFLDWSSGGAFPMQFSRSYSADFAMSAAPGGTSFGDGWRSNFDASAAYVLSSGSSLPATPATNDRIHIALPDSHEYHFIFNGGVWKPVLPRMLTASAFTWDQYRTDTRYSLVVGSNTISLRNDDDMTYVFDKVGRLDEIRLPSGISQKVEYSGGVPARVTDSLGRWLEFDYTADADLQTLLRRVRTFDGKKLAFTYLERDLSPNGDEGSSDMLLASISFPDDTPATDADNPRQIFTYAAIDIDPAIGEYSVPNYDPLASITDEKGIVFASWSYDSKGQAISSIHAGGQEGFTFVYDQTTFKTTVTNPLGKQTTYSYNNFPGNKWQLKSVEGLASTNCAPSNSTMAFDAAGFRNQLTDAEGRVTAQVNDALGRPTSITRGSGTSAAVTTNQSWHSTRPLPLQTVVPGLNSAMTYNSDGQIASVTKTDTTSTTVPFSTNGQVRTTTYGYTAMALPSVPAVTSPGTALPDLAIAVASGNASGSLSAWINQVGTLSVSTASPCTSANPCFSGGSDDSVIAYQDSVVPLANVDEVVNGYRSFELTWKQNGSLATDSAAMKVAFLDANDVLIESAPEALTAESAWVDRKLSGFMPTGTKKLRIFMVMQRESGSTNDGMIDDIVLKLIAGGSASATPFIAVQNASADAVTLVGWTPATSLSIIKSNCTYFDCFRDDTLSNEAMSQVVDLPSAFWPSIDLGLRRADLSWIERMLDETERVGFEITFLNASNVAIGTQPSESVMESGMFGWVRRSLSADVPVGTRKLHMRIRMVTSVPNVDKNMVEITGISARSC
jgi:Domain of unknown function (DUF6531)